MMNYLWGHSQADIIFAVSQISCYIYHPKRSHEIEMEQIGRYLKGTINQGLILKPKYSDSHIDMDVYVNSDFFFKMSNRKMH